MSANRAPSSQQSSLRSRLKELELLYRTAPQGFGLVDRNLRYIRANERLAEFTGWPVEEMVGRTVAEVVPEIAPQAEPIYKQVLETGEPVLDVELTGPTQAAPGKERSWLASYSPLRNEHDEVYAVSLMVRDITELRNAQALLEERAEELIQTLERTRESEDRFRKLADNVLTMFTHLDADLLYRYSNRFHREIVGRRLEDIVGRTVEEVLGEKTANALQPHLDQALAGKTARWEYQLITPTGRTGWFLGLCVPELAEDGAVTGMYGLTADITDIKETEEQLRSALADNERLRERLEEENLYLREQAGETGTYEGVVGESPAFKAVLAEAEQVAGTDATVLLQGETGVGKDVLAELIHKMSPRSGRLLVKINCAALPSTLVESELFGREKGAYTGALSRYTGRFELAHGATILLDEVSELPLELQAKLLRVLQDGEFERLGSSRTLKVDARVIAASNRDLQMAVREGKFREDLFYRLNVFPITVPPLRERREDIPLLVWTFVKELAKKLGKRIDSIPRRTMDELQSYPWPGNVREMRNVIERALIITGTSTLNVQMPSGPPTKETSMTMEALQTRHILAVLEQTGGRVRGSNGAAEILGMKPTTLDNRMKKLGIQRNPSQ